MRINKSPPARHTRQHGVALIVSLIVLLLLTLIGISAMNSTILQDRMSGNASDRSVAFQAAAAAARRGEERVRNAQLPSASGDTCNPAGGFYQTVACRGVQWKRDWRGGSGVYDYPLATEGQESGLASIDGEESRLGQIEARYIIEQLPPDTDGQGGSLVIGGNETDRRRPVYRITANATYADGSAQVTVQTTYQPYQ